MQRNIHCDWPVVGTARVISAAGSIVWAIELADKLAEGIRAPSFVVSSAHTAVVVQVSPWGFLISGVLTLILAYGLWMLRSWAFWVTVIIEIINLIGGVIALFTYYNPGAVLLSMVIPAVILIYCFADRNVRSAFNIG